MRDAAAQQRSEKNTNIWVSRDPTRLGKTRQAAVWVLLYRSCSVRVPHRCDAGSTTAREKVAICHSPRRRAEGGSFCAGEVCYMFRVRGVQKKSQEG